MAEVNPVPNWAKLITLQLMALVTSACAFDVSSGSDFAPSDRVETVNVVLKEWYVLPDKRTVDAGEVSFRVANQGRMDHEFIVIKTSVPVHALPVNDRGLDEKRAGKMIGELEDIHPGDTQEVTFHLAPGSYVLFCNKLEMVGSKVISHYRNGMRVGFAVR